MPKKKQFITQTALTFVTCFTLFSAHAQEVDSSLLDLSLEELANIEVTVASKKSISIADAPGSITAYTHKELEQYGYYTLGDLANITAGYSAFKGIGETTFETRGQMQSGFDNNKHLVLIDGIPFNHARANMALAEENLPLFFAQRIEFLKGPGSALYGTSAFYGVVNIVSKDMDKNGTKVESKFSVGNLDFKRRAMANMVHRTDEGISKFSVNYFGKDATRDYLGNGLFPNANSVNNDNSTCLFINASHKLSEGILKDLGAGFIYSRKTGGLGEFWMFHQNQTFLVNEITWEQIVPYLKYEKKLSEKISINSYFKTNISTERAYTGGYQQTINPAYGNLVLAHYNIRVIDKELLGELKYELSERTNIIGGINGITRHSTGSPESYAVYVFANPGTTFQPDPTYYTRSNNYNIYSTFIQLQHTINFLKGLNITAGTRYDAGRVYTPEEKNVINKFDQFSPRVALVQKITDELNIKFMYGTALRAPLIKEVGLNEEAKATALRNSGTAPYTYLIPDVQPEKIATFEGAITYTATKFDFSGTVFYNETQNTLGAISIPELDNARVFANSNGTINAKGFETEAQFMPIKNLNLKANYSFAKAIDPFGNETANVPTTKVNGIVTYSMFAPVEVSFTLIGRWIENYRTGLVHPFMKNNGYAQDNSTMPGFKVFDFNIVGKVTKNINLELQIRNLLNEKITTPTGIVNSGVLNVPYPGRSFMVTTGFKF